MQQSMQNRFLYWGDILSVARACSLPGAKGANNKTKDRKFFAKGFKMGFKMFVLQFLTGSSFLKGLSTILKRAADVNDGGQRHQQQCLDGPAIHHHVRFGQWLLCQNEQQM